MGSQIISLCIRSAIRATSSEWHISSHQDNITSVETLDPCINFGFEASLMLRWLEGGTCCSWDKMAAANDGSLIAPKRDFQEKMYGETEQLSLKSIIRPTEESTANEGFPF